MDGNFFYVSDMLRQTSTYLKMCCHEMNDNLICLSGFVLLETVCGYKKM